MLLRNTQRNAVTPLRAHALAALRSTRPGASLVAATLSCGVALARTGFHLQALAIGAAMWAVTAFGFVINDIFDYKKDKAAGVDRPIATDTLSLGGAATLASALLLFAFALSMSLGFGGRVLAATVIALIAYTPAVRYFTLLKAPYVAALCIAPLYYAAVVVQAQYSLVLYAVLATFIVGRETMMDANEIEGDRRAGLKTLSAVMGQTRARLLGAATMAFALGWLTLATSSSVGRTAAAVSFVSIVLVLTWPRLQESRRIELSRLPMFAAAVAIAFG